MATAYTKASDLEAGADPHILAGEEHLVALSERSVRHGFVRKVLSILLLQLIVTFGVAALVAYDHTIGTWVKTVRVWTGKPRRRAWDTRNKLTSRGPARPDPQRPDQRRSSEHCPPYRPRLL